jgi:hypothetical protein
MPAVLVGGRVAALLFRKEAAGKCGEEPSSAASPAVQPERRSLGGKRIVSVEIEAASANLWLVKAYRPNEFAPRIAPFKNKEDALEAYRQIWRGG